MTDPVAEPKRGAPLAFWLANFGLASLFYGAMVTRDLHRVNNPPANAPHHADKLIASPDDPQMLQAIRYAQAGTRHDQSGNPWSKPADEARVTIRTVGGEITLTPAEIADANTIYPQLASRVRRSR